MDRITCNVCPHACRLKVGEIGACGARGYFPDEGFVKEICYDRSRYEEVGNRKELCREQTIPLGYGIATSLALDPIEKKPLNRFYPGSRILSFGSFGCNLKCPFCQNHEISMQSVKSYDPEAMKDAYLSPERLAEIALKYRDRGNIGVAFTYNEPLINHEYIADTALLLRNSGLKTVLVTNGCVNPEIADQLLPYVDALNIDLKCFREENYRKVLKGDLEAVKSFIIKASGSCHVELTTLIVPGLNSSPEETEEIARWVASLEGGEEIPLHISRFFPRFHMTDTAPTDVSLIRELAAIAGKYLKYVYTGNL